MNGPAPGLVDDWFTWPFVAVVFIAFVLVWMGVSLARVVREDRRETELRHPSTARCGMRSDHGAPCTRPGVEWVVDNDGQAAHVCVGHLDEGSVLGWWAP